MDIASHLGHKNIGEAQEAVSSSEFVLWKVYLDELPNRFNPLHWYLAQIAYEIRVMMAGKSARRWKLTDFLIKFVWKKKEEPKKKTESQVRKELEVSKSRWMGWLGLRKDGKSNGRTRSGSPGAGAPNHPARRGRNGVSGRNPRSPTGASQRVKNPGGRRPPNNGQSK